MNFGKLIKRVGRFWLFFCALLKMIFPVPAPSLPQNAHIPDKGAQMIRYYGWYSNKMRGQRHRVRIGGVPEDPLRAPSTPPPPAKLPPKKWRDVILKVWHTDPLIFPHCQHRVRVLAVIDQRKGIEKILRHLNGAKSDFLL